MREDEVKPSDADVDRIAQRILDALNKRDEDYWASEAARLGRRIDDEVMRRYALPPNPYLWPSATPYYYNPLRVTC